MGAFDPLAGAPLFTAGVSPSLEEHRCPHETRSAQTFGVTSAPAAPIADMVEAAAFLNYEATGQLCTADGAGRGTFRRAATTRTLLEHASRQLELLALRSLELADRVAAGEIAFLDAVDIAYDAAVWAGLTSNVGDDVVQATLAAAFANARRPK
jgi:hypothetical protein